MVEWVEIGPCRVCCADCLPCMDDIASADVLITDPPYSIVNKFGKQERLDGTRTLQWEWDNQCTPQYVTERVRRGLMCLPKSSSFFVWCGTDQVGDLLPMFRELDFTPKAAAWVKKCPPPAMPGTWWPSGFELGFYGYRNGAWFGDENTSRSNVWVFDSYRHGQPGKVDHPTQKPLLLMQHIVMSQARVGDMVLDPFMGSGTTGVACIRTGRQFIGIEKEPKYFEIACKRLEREWQLKRSELPLFEEKRPEQRTFESILETD